MFQRIEKHMKNIVRGKEPLKQNSSQHVNEKFVRTCEVHKAYGLFKNQFKSSLHVDEVLPKNAAHRIKAK
jgi:hypothetical protein